MVLYLIASPSERAKLGPADWYRLVARDLRMAPDGEVIASYDGEAWVAAHSRFTTVLCEGPVVCHFESGTTRHDDVEGPFQKLTLVGAVVWGDDHPLARVETDGFWRLLRTGNVFRAISWRPPAHHPGFRRLAQDAA